MLNAVKLFSQDRIDLKKRCRLSVSQLLLFFSVSLSATPAFTQENMEQKTGVAKEIFAIITANQHPDLTQANFANRSEDLDKLYKMGNYQLLWLGRADSEQKIAETLNLLANASIQGLKQGSYDTEFLKQKLPEILTLKPDAVKRLALYDTALSLSLLRFLHDLHYGRVNPQGINFNLKLREKKLADLPILIKGSLGQGTIAKLPEIVEPKLIQYQKLKQALAHYHQLEAITPPLQFQIKKSVRIGDHHPQIAELTKFLIAIGDLHEDQKAVSPKGSELYTSKISKGVKKFQLRHGLAADGIIGNETASAISIPLSQRINQIELALERLRWLPEIYAGSYIIVNIPAFQLWAFDDISKKNPEIVNMKVVVGKALKNQTPVLMAKMRYIDFMPYWNVPYSIVKNEILPKLIKDPDYLNKENMEIVTGFGTQAKTVEVSYGSLMQLKQGSLKIRQRPGRKNALGRVKFMFPNKEDVYLHDTPANALFSRSRRDFSHGCVRVDNPEGLANFILKDQKGWDKDKITQALKSSKTERVILNKSIPVLFFYITSFVDQDDNLTFFSDIYGHDAVLSSALQKAEDLSDQSLFISKTAGTSGGTAR